MTMKAVLVALPDGSPILVDKDKTLIGRNPGNDIVVEEPFVSRKHCAVAKKGVGYFLEDLNSTNGTFLNGKRIEEAVRLRHNDTFFLGQESRAYRFGKYLTSARKLEDFIRKPRNLALVGAGIAAVILAVFLSIFLGSRKKVSIDVIQGLRKLERLYGENAIPGDAAFRAEVERWVETVRNDRAFASIAERRNEYKDMIESTLRKNNLPVEYSLIAWAESQYDPFARNGRSRAAGMWQLLPATARGYGLQVDRYADDRLDPVKATQAAALYLNDLVSIFGHDSFLLVLAAYNAGDGVVRYGLKRIQDPVKDRDFWYLYKNNLLPGETKQFVLKVVALIIIADGE